MIHCSNTCLVFPALPATSSAEERGSCMTLTSALYFAATCKGRHILRRSPCRPYRLAHPTAPGKAWMRVYTMPTSAWFPTARCSGRQNSYEKQRWRNWHWEEGHTGNVCISIRHTVSKHHEEKRDFRQGSVSSDREFVKLISLQTFNYNPGVGSEIPNQHVQKWQWFAVDMRSGKVGMGFVKLGFFVAVL